MPTRARLLLLSVALSLLAATAWAEPALSPKLSPLRIPASLKAQTPLEASGLAWIAEIGRFLLISDDTGYAKSGRRHRPWVFLMNPTGEVEAAPLEIAGLHELNDLESIAPDGEKRAFLLASQSVNKKGKRETARTELYWVERQAKSWRLLAKASVFTALMRDVSPAQRHELGLSDGPAPTLNIEASVLDNGELLLGLKEPRAAQGALLWRLKDPERFVRSGSLRAGQLTRLATVRLNTAAGQNAAFSDLAKSPDGALYALSTVPNANGAAQEGGFHRLWREADGSFRVETLARFPGRKPEGLSFTSAQQALIVFDEGDAVPLYTEITLPKAASPAKP